MISEQTASKSIGIGIEGLKIIDCDSHFTEPPDLWLSRVGPAWRDRVPVQRTVDGRTQWYLDGQEWCDIGGNTIRSGGEKVLGSFRVQPFADIDEASWDVSKRLRMLDELGIYAQILYPNGIGFASNYVFAIEDESQRRMILQTYNDFYIDIQKESSGRLLPQGLLPIWDMPFALEEMQRLLDRGITGFTLSDKPELLGLPELIEPYFDPMWDLFNESGAVANFHIAAGRSKAEMEARRKVGYGAGAQAPQTSSSVSPAWASLPRQRNVATGATQACLSNIRVIVNLCMSNLFDRFPRVRIVSAESGIGWVPFMLESMEYQFDEMVTEESALSYAKRRPTEYFRDHIYVSFWFERIGVEKLLNEIGVDNVLVETDIPHPTCLYPGPKEHFQSVLAGLDPLVARKVLQDNAAELYGLSLTSEE